MSILLPNNIVVCHFAWKYDVFMTTPHSQINGSTDLKLWVTHVHHAALCCRYIQLSEKTKNVWCPQMVPTGKDQGAGWQPNWLVYDFNHCLIYFVYDFILYMLGRIMYWRVSPCHFFVSLFFLSSSLILSLTV